MFTNGSKEFVAGRYSMNRTLLSLAAVLLLGAAPPASPHWTRQHLDQLEKWSQIALAEGLQIPAEDIAAAQSKARNGDEQAADLAATRAALALLASFRDGCCNTALRTHWHIAQNLPARAPLDALADSLARDRLNTLFAASRPGHLYYFALADAYARETDPKKRTVLAANLNRWRWMPRDLGPRYLLVNAAAFEASLWEDGAPIGRWQVIVGKTGSPTPVFRASVTGVIVNPWWDIPPRIAAEGIAGLLAKNPAEAARRGYVREGGRYRQRPGATNALGRMKLVMPNSFGVYLHDTPAQSLFDEDVRTFSHGCVRVGDALGLATTLLGADWERHKLDELVVRGRTETLPLRQPIPVYITYFTAEPDELGAIQFLPDVYHRDTGAQIPDANGHCPA